MKTETKKTAVEMRLGGMSINVIAKSLGVSKSTVSLWVRNTPKPHRFTEEFRAEKKRLRLACIETARRERLNKVVYHSSGYRLLRAPDGYKGTKNGPYVYEHRYVLEKAIGRVLRADEHVHHKNGICTDNRVENLEIVDSREHAVIHLPPNSRPLKVNHRICPACGDKFSRRIGLSAVCCSRRCAAINGHRSGKYLRDRAT
jgi:hypothetical protein